MKITQKTIDQLIEEATVDCYDDYEYAQGILCAVEDGITCPFDAQVLGYDVKVVELMQIGSQLKAVCEKDRKEYKIDLMDLKVDYKNVSGGGWIAVYKHWKSNE